MPFLARASVVRVEPWMPGDDYFGLWRAVPATAGASECPVSPTPLAPKREAGRPTGFRVRRSRRWQSLL